MKPIKTGKVREIYDLDDNTLLVVTTDRISAFDVVLPTTIPSKGKILNQLSAFWFDFTKNAVDNHMISIDNADMPSEFQTPEFEGRCMLVKRLKMLPIEAIIRGYITGSGWESYQKSGSVCGIQLPKNLQESQQLPSPLYTPTTKADEGHDEHITYEQTVDLIGKDLAEKVRDISIHIYDTCSLYAMQHNIIIADTKFEFGVDKDGNLFLADEVLTPDSSRFWPLDGYKTGTSQPSFDKQFVRDWLKQSNWDKTPPAPELPQDVICETQKKYLEAYKMLTGTVFA